MPRRPPGKEKFKAPLKGTTKITRPPSYRTLYLAMALVTVAFLVGGYVFYHFQEQQMRQRIEGGLSIVAQLKTEQIAQWRAERLVDASMLVGSPFFTEGVEEYMASPADTEAKDKVLARLELVGKAYPYQDILLTDVNGDVLLSLNESVNRLSDMTSAQLAVAIKEHKAVMTDFHYTPDGNSPRLDVIAPLFPWGVDSQQAVGAVVFCINPAQSLWPLVQSWPIPSETAETYLVERDGDQVLFLNELRYQKDTALKLRIPLSQQENPAVMAVLGKEGVVEGKDYRGVEVLAALKNVPDSPWYMVAKIDTSEELSAWLFRAGIIIASVAALLSASLAATGLIWQRRQRLAYQALYEAEVESQALRRHFEYLVKYANDIIILADEDHHIIEANDRALETYGYTREGMLGLPLAALIPPGGFSSYQERLRKIQKGATVAEGIHQREDGSTFPVEVSGRVIRIEDKPYIQEIIRDITERKKAEETLRRSEDRYRTVLEQMEDAYFEVDIAGNFTFFNDALCRQLGYSREELIGGNYRVYTAEDDVPRVYKAFNQVYKTGKPLKGIPMVRIRKDGTRIFAETSAFLLRNESGEIIGFRGIVRDFTERTHAEEALRLSEHNFRDSIENSPLGIRVLDSDGKKTVYANRALLDIWGYSSVEEMEAVPRKQRYTPESYAAHLKRLKKRKLGEHVPLNYETSIVRSDGEVRILSVSRGELLWNGEKRFQLVYQDITERKQAEKALAESEEKYRTVLEGMGESYYEVDLAGNFTFFNDALCRQMGYSREELTGMNYKVYTPPEDVKKVFKVYSGVYRTGEPVHVDMEEIRKDGTRLFVENSVLPLRNEVGEIIGLCGIGRDVTERKKAEEALRISEHNFRDSIENSPLGIRIVDEDGNTLYANRALLDTWGYSSLEELKEVPRKQRFTPQSYDEHRIRVEKRERGEHVTSNYEMSIMRSDGQVRILSVSRGEVLWNGEKKFQVVHQDITERKQAEEALSKSEEKYRTILKEMEDGYFEVDLAGNFTFANDSMCRYLRYPMEELLGMNYRSCTAKEEIERMYRAYNEVYRTGKPNRGFNSKIVRKDGSIGFADVKVSLLRNQGGDIIGFRGLGRDVTERKQAEEALRESEARHRTLFETMAQGVVYQNAEGLIISANPAAERILGLTLDQMMGKTSIDPRWKAIHEDGSDFPGDTHPAMVALKTGKPVRNVVMGVFHPGFNKHVWININAIPQFLAGESEPYQVYTTFEDITELKLAAEELEKAVEELQRSNAELERFAYVASHDLQEPLRMVSSYTQLLERRYKDKLDADANDFINYAVDGAGRMQELLNDLLVYSRVGTRAKPFKLTDMGAVLGAALDNLQVTIKESKARVSHDSLPTLMADEGQMVQVLQNLISNAVKFRGEKSPRIRVSAEQRDSEWVFSVKDNGIGIEPQYFDRVFLIFQRLHRDEYPGTGTGLAIAKRIVERHGGRMWIESQPGKGSTFYFSIKAAGNRQQARGASDERREMSDE
jgi:PAS domain S-box-containing protein